MPRRRQLTRFRIGILGVCLAVGVFVTAEPGADPQSVKSIQAPTIRFPSISAKSIAVPVAGQTPAPMRQLPVMSPEMLAAYEEAAARNLDYLPGQVLMKFKSGVSRAGQQRALMALRSRPHVSVLEWIGDVAVLKDTTQADAGMLSSQLSAQSEVAWAQPNYLLRPDATPSDPSYNARQWNLRAINMPRAWDIAAGGSNNVIVAVIDSGVTTIPVQNISVFTWNGSAIVSHSMPVGLSPDFDTSRFVSPRDFIVSSTSPSTLVVDTDSHGTHVAGTVGENTNNGVALAGIAYNARIMPLKVCQGYWDVQFARSAAGIPGFTTVTTATCPSSATIAAIRFAADNGADVINMSLGGFSPNSAMRDALAYAVSKGVFIAVSNGNDATEGNDTGYPAFYAPDIDGMMSVAATGQTNRHAFYSTTNDRTEISAPGGDNQVGDVVWQASIRASDSTIGAFGVIFPRFDRYDERGKQGTSMASPHVAGVAALLASRGITNPATIEAILRQTALDLGATGKDVQYGYGLVQPFKALFGQGILR